MAACAAGQIRAARASPADRKTGWCRASVRPAPKTGASRLAVADSGTTVWPKTTGTPSQHSNTSRSQHPLAARQADRRRFFKCAQRHASGAGAARERSSLAATRRAVSEPSVASQSRMAGPAPTACTLRCHFARRNDCPLTKPLQAGKTPAPRPHTAEIRKSRGRCLRSHAGAHRRNGPPCRGNPALRRRSPRSGNSAPAG